MDITLHLILAHFLADYPLQPNRLVAYKVRHFSGIVIHSLTHALTSLLLGFPFILQGRFWWAVLAVFVTHNLIDKTKLVAQGHFREVNAFIFYVADQVLHLAVIFASSWIWLRNLVPDLGGAWLKVYESFSLMNFFLALILVTYFYDVSRWTYRNALKAQPYVRDWKMMGRNALFVTVAFVTYWLMV